MFRSRELVAIANARLMEKNISAVAEAALVAREKSPENDEAWVVFAATELGAGRKSGALDALRRAVDLNPANKRQLPRNRNFESFIQRSRFQEEDRIVDGAFTTRCYPRALEPSTRVSMRPLLGAGVTRDKRRISGATATRSTRTLKDVQLVCLNSSVTEQSRCLRGMSLAYVRCMEVTKQLRQYVGRRATKRLYRAMPWIGSVVALATLGAAVRRKGFLGGTADTVLDFIPWVGGVKNLTEAARGGDFIPDKPASRS
jgi:hypothetical protein